MPKGNDPVAAAEILIVDDVEYNRDILEKILRAAGYQTVKAGDGAEALNYAKKHTPDLILLDVRMPNLSGYDVCQKLLADEKFSKVPIIFITSEYKDDQSIKTGLQMGGLYYITRPVDRGELLARVRVGLRIRENFKNVMGRLDKLESSCADFFRLTEQSESKLMDLEAKVKELKDQLSPNSN
ncbi:MAG: response regulator [Candidatus Margulisiibacteriota bacterium]|nr:response regulator [Candidatus Margulisiibacteriota bacterium]